MRVFNTITMHNKVKRTDWLTECVWCGSAAGVPIKKKGCLAVAECNKTSEVTFPGDSNTTIFSLFKRCCDTDLCNAAPGLPATSGLSLALATVTALFVAHVLVWQDTRWCHNPIKHTQVPFTTLRCITLGFKEILYPLKSSSLFRYWIFSSICSESSFRY